MIVPVRSGYGSKKTQNIGVNYLKSTDGTSLWYTVSDLIASKLLTGHTPTIEKAITFHPVGVQQKIPDEKIEIFKGIAINPRNENFIEQLIEKRLEMKQSSVDDSEIDKTIQNTIKIIANTASYGIHIQVNSQKSERQNELVTVYGVDDELFSVNSNTISREEIPSRHFNPILGVLLPAAARLVLAAAESLVTSHRDGFVAYMDTDSIMVSTKHANEIQEFFQILNPYANKDVQTMKIEKSDDGKPLEDVLFYGISSKRYVLFGYNVVENKFNIYKLTSHGLAHLLDVDKKQWWHDILAMHYHPENKQEILDRYDDKYAVSKMSITTPNMLKRFCNLRPFDKILVGAGYKTDDNGNVVIPTLPYLDAKQRECIRIMKYLLHKFKGSTKLKVKHCISSINGNTSPTSQQNHNRPEAVHLPAAGDQSDDVNQYHTIYDIIGSSTTQEEGAEPTYNTLTFKAKPQNESYRKWLTLAPNITRPTSSRG